MVQTEKLRKEFSLRLSQALDASKYPPHGRGIRLARELGVTSKAVSKWLSGESFPRQAMIESIAKLLNVDYLWLQHGSAAEKGESGLVNALFRRGFPLLDWKDVGRSTVLTDDNFKNYAFYASGSKIDSNDAFWLKVKDDSMTSPVGLCVPINSMILVETDKQAKAGDLVIVQLAELDEATFKQYVVDAGTNQKYLKPLNTHFKPIELPDSAVIVGVVVESRMSFVKPDLADMTYS
ncbi:LexA family protein [Candidatus Pantoea formicae]|uniref:LexA family protein n=1 Tax=Candidatus Pantoea formicae TaxID=2608355 RepID=UPI003ED92CBB